MLLGRERALREEIGQVVLGADEARLHAARVGEVVARRLRRDGRSAFERLSGVVE